MGIKILKLRHKFAPPATGCRWCGIEQRGHAEQWVPSQKWHEYVQPTPSQISARIRARCAERQAPKQDWFRPLHEERRSS